MKKFLLDSPAKTTFEKLTNIAFGFSFIIFWVGLMSFLFSFAPIEGIVISTGDSFMLYMFILSCVVAPLWEELYYRVGMLGIAKAIGRNAIVPALIVTSVLFGLAHGHTIWNLAVQGVMGFVFGMVYVKNGFSYWSSVLLHASWNLFVLFTTGS